MSTTLLELETTLPVEPDDPHDPSGQVPTGRDWFPREWFRTFAYRYAASIGAVLLSFVAAAVIGAFNGWRFTEAVLAVMTAIIVGTISLAAVLQSAALHSPEQVRRRTLVDNLANLPLTNQELHAILAELHEMEPLRDSLAQRVLT